MYCKHCGKQIDDDSTFCKWCGNNLEAGEEVTTVASQDAHNSSAADDLDVEDVPPRKRSRSNALIAAGISTIFLVAVFLRVAYSSEFAEHQPSQAKFVTQAQNGATASESGLSAVGQMLSREQANLNAANERFIKETMSNPQTAVFIHDPAGTSVNNATVTCHGTVKFANASGTDQNSSYTTRLILSENSILCLFVKIDDKVLVDRRDYVTSLGLITESGASFYGKPSGSSVFPSGEAIMLFQDAEPLVSLHEYNLVEIGVPYYEVAELFDSFGEETSRAGSGVSEMANVVWKGNGGKASVVSITFENGYVSAKAQSGLV